MSKPPRTELMPKILLDPPYGKGAPKWVQGINQSPSLTYKGALAESDRLNKLLRRHGKNEPVALKLATKFERCELQHLCDDGGCVVTLWAAQRFWVRASDVTLRENGEKMLAVSVIWSPEGCREGELDGDLFEGLRKQLHKALTACGIEFAIGAFDVSANEHEDNKFAPHFRPQAWIFVPERAFRGAEKLFRSFFPRSKLVPRPVVCKPFDGNLAGLAYAMKTSFVRRVSLTPKKMPDGTYSSRNTRNRPLRASQQVELMLALSEAGLRARMFLHGAKLVDTDDGVQIRRK